MTVFQGEPVRPHSLRLDRQRAGTFAKVKDVIRLGFEVRVNLQLSDGAELWVQLTHDEAIELSPLVGEQLRVSKRSDS